MKFKKYDNFDNVLEIKYWICLWDENGMYYSGYPISQYLGLSIRDYNKIIKKYNGKKWDNDNMIYFSNIRDYNNCIEKLEPYLIMATLTE